ncbi:fungal-specific transcription factor domain-domain-containing protein [Coniella lustricola]|uniref:Fungal-specific transcription factor domain-domain-containing protein n=1 Tax=Coniella lustricola TaxID=2025994 RepID=A0A2T3AN53_9PEZI|nr:fungal-specific transcription factor domain-domain-containing protein [Coniella lustricola]
MGTDSVEVSDDAMGMRPTPEADSENESGNGSEQQDGQQSPDDSPGQGSGKEDVGDEDFANSSQADPMPVQKRRRVTRACDECRRKKIKCDGKQPCTHCSVYSYECTYDKPSNRRRNPAPQYIEALENKLARAEALLRKFIPDVDLNDPNLDPATQQEFQTRERQRLQATKSNREEMQQPEQTEAKITSMIETFGQLDLDECGWDFRGTSSGAVFVKRMTEHLGGLLEADRHETFLPRPDKIPGLTKLDTTAGASPGDANYKNVYDLPPQVRAHKLSTCAVTCATALLRIVHVPSYFEKLEAIYCKSPNSFDTEDNRFLGLFYAVLAVGSMYDIVGEDDAVEVTYQRAFDEGVKYYTCARILLQDVTECRDLTTLQALLFLILFLQATSNLSGCYSFLGIASRTALRMGLHRHLPQANLTPLESELRKRIFYFIRQMDIYCSALLGFPILLYDDDVDQQLPTEVDDEYITADGIQTPPIGTPGSFFQAFNAHSRLMRILMKVVKYIYPLKGIEECTVNSSGQPHATYNIDYNRIKEIENDLQAWHEQLPQRWRPSSDGPIEVLRVRTLLRFAYAHVQMMLYRPFLHYISPRLWVGRVVDERYYACAAAGISVSRNIIHIAREIKNQALVVGPFWSMLYTEYFAVLTLVFYVLENPDKQGSAEIFGDAKAGREMIGKMATRSFAAARISKSLDTLWNNLPDKIKSGKTRVASSRKRAAPGPKDSTEPLVNHKLPSTAIKVIGAVARKPPNSKPIPDNVQLKAGRPAVSMNYPELHALDITSAITSNADASVLSSAATTASNHYMRTSQVAGSPSVYKLDAMMFPTGDPFAYPNQPLLDFGGVVATQPESNPSHISSVQSQSADARNFYMSGVYGDIEGQLMGYTPSHLMQSSSSQNGMDLSAHLYPSAQPMAMQQAQAHHGNHIGHGHHQHHAQMHHRVGREIDDILADSGFNRNWDLFGGTFKPL